MYPYIGESVIATGLYSPRDGTRLALTGTELDQLAYRVASIRLEPQHESSFVTYGEGWHEAEFSADGRTQWRWTTGRGVLSFRNPNRDSRFVLEFDGRADLFDPDQRLSLVIGDRTIEELEIDTTEVVYVTCEIPAADLGSDDIVNLELRVDRTFTPRTSVTGRRTRASSASASSTRTSSRCKPERQQLQFASARRRAT